MANPDTIVEQNTEVLVPQHWDCTSPNSNCGVHVPTHPRMGISQLLFSFWQANAVIRIPCEEGEGWLEDKTCTTTELVQNWNPTLQRIRSLQRLAAQQGWKSFHVLKNSKGKKWLHLSSGNENQTRKRQQDSNKKQHRNEGDSSHSNEVLLLFNFCTSLFWTDTRNCTYTASSTSYIVVYPIQQMRVQFIQTEEWLSRRQPPANLYTIKCL